MKEFTRPVSNLAIFLENDRHFLEALTRWNYFPNQKDSASELPPCFSTSRFTPEIAEELVGKVQISEERKKLWFDLVEYRATRYNNIPRLLGLIHPLAYSRIYAAIKESQAEIIASVSDENSAVSVERHNDGRMFIINYEDHETKTKSTLERSFGMKFRAHADIANCFGSIYTHSLEWAAQGYEAAKENLRQKSRSADKHWSTKLDTALRNAKRNETSGLPVGPASSSIAVEIILAAVDRSLAQKFCFVRYIDDYTAYCESHVEAQDFIRSLSNELAKYRLSLNLAKTIIVELPEPLQAPWVSALSNALPSRADSNGTLALTTHEAIIFMDFAVHLNKETPDGSVLKFAASLICHRADGTTAVALFKYILNLSWHYPVLLPILEKIDARSEDYSTEQLSDKLNKIISVNAHHRRSDGMCWALYYLKQIQSQPTEASVTEIISSQDCVAIAMLCIFDNAIEAATEYAIKLIANATLYELDQNWLLLYQLFITGKIENPYTEDDTFNVLKHFAVQFLYPPEKASRAEAYCFMLSNPFVDEGNKITFDKYMSEKEAVE